MNALRTPDDRFQALPGFGYAARYIDDLAGSAGLRVHYIDEGPRDAPVTALCLHGNPSWCYLYRHMIPVFTAAAPMPPPMHIVTHTRLAPLRLPSISAWPVSRCPLTP
jgi:hypothetical protein